VRRLIVNSDDFGLTRGINRGIVELHAQGALDSATLMAMAPQFEEAAKLALQNPSLGVGCHVVLVDGIPAADPRSIPSLLDRSSGGEARFRSSLGVFIRDLFLGRIERSEIELEARAQLLLLQEAGIHSTHVDTHKHTHMFPLVMDSVSRAAAGCGVRAIRNPFEPEWSVQATPRAGATRKLQVRVLRCFRDSFLRKVRQFGLVTTDGCIGVLATGTLDEESLRTILPLMLEGTWELVCHPGYLDGDLRAAHTRLKESRARENSALRSMPEILNRLGQDVQRLHFGEL
jgi:predicted glycoside hydrolase/deacetylase ChbG (UPF0249 family)